MKKEQSRETGNIGYGTQDETKKQKKTQHNICATLLYANTYNVN